MPQNSDTIPADALPSPSHLIELLELLADRWAMPRPTNIKINGAAASGRDGAVRLGESLGVRVEYQHSGETALIGARFPCIVLLKDGGMRLLTGYGHERFEALGPGGPYSIARAQIEPEALPTWLVVSPQPIADQSAQFVSDQAEPEKTKDFSCQRTIVAGLFGKHRKLVVQLCGAAVISNLTLLTLPVFSGIVYDRVLPHAASETLWALTLGVGLALLLDFVMRWTRLQLSGALSAQLDAGLQGTLFHRVAASRRTDAPRLSGRVLIWSGQIQTLCQLAPVLFTGAFIDIPFLLLVLSLIGMNGGFVVAAPVAAIALLVAAQRLSHAMARRWTAKADQSHHLQTDILSETVELHETLKAARQDQTRLSMLERAHDAATYALHRSKAVKGLAAYAAVTIGQFAFVGVIVIGYYRIVGGAMSIGELSTCTLLVGRIIGPLSQLVGAIDNVLDLLPRMVAVDRFIAKGVEEAGDRSGAAGRPSQGRLSVNGLSFAYPGRSDAQLSGLTISIAPGEKVALVGRTGSGKSTLLKLLARLEEAGAGTVLLDQRDILHYGPDDVRRHIAYMGQTPYLINDTLAANMTLGASDVEPERFDAIAQLTGLGELAQRHQNGFGLQVGPRGEYLSGGERQMTQLARTLMQDSKVILLDEPTSAMDTMTELRLVKDLRPLMADKTLILATHRAPMLDLVDRLIWINNGTILADGPKAEVLARISGKAA